MQITDLLKPQSVLLNADPVTKADAIYTLGELMEKGGNLIDKGEYLAAVLLAKNLVLPALVTASLHHMPNPQA